MLHSKIYSHAARRKPLVSIVNRAKCLMSHQDPELECLWPLGPDYILWKVTLQSLVQRRACEMLENFLENWTILQHSTLWSTVAICSRQQYGSYGSVEIYQHPRLKSLGLCEHVWWHARICHSYSCMTMLSVTKHALLINGLMGISRRCSGHHNPRRQTTVPYHTYPEASWESVQSLELV